jgi:hypothetical protein
MWLKVMICKAARELCIRYPSVNDDHYLVAVQIYSGWRLKHDTERGFEYHLHYIGIKQNVAPSSCTRK